LNYPYEIEKRERQATRMNLWQRTSWRLMIDKESISESITHIAGTFLIDAAGSFLNGAGLGSGEDRSYTHKKFGCYVHYITYELT
jgi:hypothetical protein